jgi:TolB-like protein/DNA-binding winged helix-turn-helix (wHTH) protein/Tfp pilus assembly protein PilF
MTQPNQQIRFGVFEVDPRSGELRSKGSRVKLQDQPLQILLAVLEKPGEVVTREELRAKLWPADTFVDFDHGLNAAVKRLRDALGDTAENPRYIETLPRRGYRFIAAVVPDAIQPEQVESPPRRWVLLLACAVLTVLAAVLFVEDAGGLRSRFLFRSAKAQIHSLAVLPLENLSGDPEQQYFSDGMTDALTSQLSKIGGLRVISHTSAARYKGTKKSMPEIARELSVDGVIEGSVMRSGDRVRIVVQLIQAQTDQQRWTEAYERGLGDILKLQSDVAQAVAQQVRMQLTPAEQAQLRSASVVDPEAYEAYLKGRFYEDEGTQATIKQAQGYYEEAVRRDPGFALAYVGLADSYLELGSYRWMPPQEAYRRGSEAVHKALEFDAGNSEAHSTLGYLDWRYTWDWQTAERELRHAVELDANDIHGHETLVWFLAWRGRYGEALAEVEKIRLLDPVYPLIYVDEAGVYYHQRDYKSLIEVSQKSVAAYPNLRSSHHFLAVGYEGSGRLTQAVPEYQRAVELSQRDSDPVAGLAHVYATTGRVAEAKKLLGELQQQSRVTYVSPYMIATIYSGLGQMDKAFEFLERAYQERSPDLIYFVKADLRIDGLRSDPRFQDLLGRMNFPK